jgi:hypothetical protein
MREAPRPTQKKEFGQYGIPGDEAAVAHCKALALPDERGRAGRKTTKVNDVLPYVQ